MLIIVIATSLLAACGTAPHRTPLAGYAVAPDVSLLRGTFVPGAQPDGNSVLLRGRDRLIVVDSDQVLRAPREWQRKYCYAGTGA